VSTAPAAAESRALTNSRSITNTPIAASTSPLEWSRGHDFQAADMSTPWVAHLVEPDRRGVGAGGAGAPSIKSWPRRGVPASAPARFAAHAWTGWSERLAPISMPMYRRIGGNRDHRDDREQ